MSAVIEERTRKKVAALAAYGFDNQVIGDALLLTKEAVEEIRTTPEFLTTYAEKLSERADRAIDLEEGWDAVEERAVMRTLQALEYNTDPRFALQAAAVANRAQRRAPQPNKTIDATRSQSMIILSMNRTYIEGKQTSEQSAVLVVEQKENTLQKKRVDMPSPKRVSELLQIKTKEEVTSEMSEIEQIAERHGIDVDLFDGG